MFNVGDRVKCVLPVERCGFALLNQEGVVSKTLDGDMYAVTFEFPEATMTMSLLGTQLSPVKGLTDGPGETEG
jgi:hypothetical protein